MSNVTIATEPLTDDSELVSPNERVENRLKLIFAIQSCLGGLVLSSGEDTADIAIIAIFFAVFGYVFVDLLSLFALPSIAAYAAMTAAALLSISRFSDFTSPGQQQMIAVGGLLINVQSILMLQVKTRRIFEQLIIFSLLELIVAAVFNNAIYYAFVMIPMLFLSVASLSLMSSLATWDGVESSPHAGFHTPAIRVWSPSTASSFDASVMRFPRLVLAIFGPAVIFVGLIFFYALPRIGNAKRAGSGGSTSIGFSESLELGRMGRMLQNSEPVLRVTLNRRNEMRPYLVQDSLYLRGLVFENYLAGEPGTGGYASWGPVTREFALGEKAIPPQYLPPDPKDDDLFEWIDVKIMAEPLSSKSLFMIAPYHRSGPAPGMAHSVSSWTTHRTNYDSESSRKFDYAFGTPAFQRGQQVPLLTPLSHPLESLISVSSNESTDRSLPEKKALLDLADRTAVYRQATLEIDEDEQPTAIAISKRIADQISLSDRNPYNVAIALEQFLQTTETFSYTLNLDSEPVPALDPIEQFLAIDKKGHCQYFASALVMMLRSQRIPARVVAGYNTDEFNELGKYYMVRQLHAHAWVEALVPRDSLPKTFLNPAGYVPGQLPADEYWLRLDPTPAAGRDNRNPASGIDQVMDLAKNMWDEYVVDMDGNRQDKSLIGKQGKTPMSESYASLIAKLQLQISRIRNGELGGGAWAGRDVFSIPAALLGIGMVLVTLVLLRFRLPNWLRNRSLRKGSRAVAEPSIPFYAEALRQLGRLGLYRGAGQTPEEFTSEQALNPQYAEFTKPLSMLTSAFYRYRFGQDPAVRSFQVLEPQIESALAQISEKVDRIQGKNT